MKEGGVRGWGGGEGSGTKSAQELTRRGDINTVSHPAPPGDRTSNPGFCFFQLFTVCGSLQQQKINRLHTCISISDTQPSPAPSPSTFPTRTLHCSLRCKMSYYDPPFQHEHSIVLHVAKCRTTIHLSNANTPLFFTLQNVALRSTFPTRTLHCSLRCKMSHCESTCHGYSEWNHLG